MATYSIRDLEKISGIKAHTIRIWEKRYEIIQPSRTPTNIRFYSDNDLRKLLNISFLSRNGLKISKIANLGNDEIGEKVLLFTQKANHTENTIESLIISMIELDENKFERILSNIIIKLGFEETFTNILHPFFEKIGILWQAGTIIPAHEHFISGLVRQKLIVAIDGLRDKPIIKNSQFLLFLPEGEFHELGLLFYQYSLKKRGFKTLYLGQSVPIENLIVINKTSKSAFFLTNITFPFPEKQLRNLFNQLTKEFVNQQIFIFGAITNKISFELPKNISKILSPNDFIAQLEFIN